MFNFGFWMMNGGAERRGEGAEAAMFNFEFWILNGGTGRGEGAAGGRDV